MDPILSRLDVSRETIDRLQFFQSLLEKWNPKINLVSKASLQEIWTRHILDSAQVFDIAPEWTRWGDLGSGGGFPGLVVAILALEKNSTAKTKLVESDHRKATFLQEASRLLGLKTEVLVGRAEGIERLGVQVLSARALASLDRLLELSHSHLEKNGTCLFFKGVTWQKEVEQARGSWSFSVVPHMSETDSKAAILEIKEISRV